MYYRQQVTLSKEEAEFLHATKIYVAAASPRDLSSSKFVSFLKQCRDKGSGHLVCSETSFGNQILHSSQTIEKQPLNIKQYYTPIPSHAFDIFWSWAKWNWE